MKFGKVLAVALGVLVVSTPAVSTAQSISDVVPGQGSRPYQQEWPKAPKFDGCADLIVKSVPGTWETEEKMEPYTDAGMMGDLNKQIRAIGEKSGVSVDTSIVPYPAKFGGAAQIATGDTMEYPVSESTGVDNTVKALAVAQEKCPDSSFAVAGFSQGADVAGDVMEMIASGDAKGVDLGKMVGALIYADPKRSPSTANPESKDDPGKIIQPKGTEKLVSDKPIPGEGLLGVGRDFGSVDDGIFTFCLEGDAVCAMPKSGDGISDFLKSMGGDSRGKSTADSGVAGTEADSGESGFRIAPGLTLGLPKSGGSNPLVDLLSSLTPEDVQAVMSFLPTHTGDTGHSGYGVNKAIDGKTPLTWGAETIVQRAKDGDFLSGSKPKSSDSKESESDVKSTDKEEDSTSKSTSSKADKVRKEAEDRVDGGSTGKSTSESTEDDRSTDRSTTVDSGGDSGDTSTDDREPEEDAGPSTDADGSTLSGVPSLKK